MKADNFSLPDQDGKTHKLDDYSGRWVVLYFYPKDDTPGCTKEACSFRDASQDFSEKGVAILGVSKDSVASHKKFSEKYRLNFPILADVDKKVIQAYKAWGEKKFLGKVFEGVIRTTYLINPKGEIAKTYPNVNPLNHAGEVLKDIEKLAS